MARNSYKGWEVRVERKRFLRPTYWHHGVIVDASAADADNWRVIHYQKRHGRGEIVETSLLIFKDGANEVMEGEEPGGAHFAPDEVVKRARSKLGEADYDLFGNNCEHFAKWCVTGVRFCRQMIRAGERGERFFFPMFIATALGVLGSLTLQVMGRP